MLINVFRHESSMKLKKVRLESLEVSSFVFREKSFGGFPRDDDSMKFQILTQSHLTCYTSFKIQLFPVGYTLKVT